MTQDNRDINKSQIRARMRRLAADKLGVVHIEQLDPVIGLFLDSLSEEVYRLGGEIENTEERIIDKLASLLAPSIESMAHPAHCILHASPISEGVELTPQTQFGYYDRKKNNLISFYPTSYTKIHNGKVRYFAHNGLIYNIERDLTKTLLARNQRNYSNNQVFWLALELNEEMVDLSGISFYFDLPAIYNKTEYLNLLSHTIWTIAGANIAICKGLINKKEIFENRSLNLFSNHGPLNRINTSILNHYKNNFLTISKECLVEKKEYIPNELQSTLPENIRSKIENPLVWIKVECPRALTSEIIESLQISINAFPVLNKELVSRITEVNKTIPIIPLNTTANQSFFCVHSVSDSTGKQYHDAPINEDCGIYALRKGGIEGYDKRAAKEYLTTIIEILNKEAFSFIKDRGDMKMDVKMIEAAVSNLIKGLKKQQSKQTDWYEVDHYLMLTPDKDHEIFFIDYWITNGQEGNNIRAGEYFSSFSEFALHQLSIYSLTSTQGGTFAPLGEKKKNFYKKSLTSHNLLVTDEDVVLFCLKEFEASISEVTVRKGFMKSSNFKTGFIETTDVYLTPLINMKHYLNEKDEENFLQILKENSPATYNYRVFIHPKTQV